MNGEKRSTRLQDRVTNQARQHRLDLGSQETQTNVPPLMRLEESARRRQGLDRLGEDIERSICHVVHCAPEAQALGRGHHLQHITNPKLRKPHRSLLDGLDDVFKKITTPWRRRRLVR
jgi:hypothetical protein